jgi:hypothetical protein
LLPEVPSNSLGGDCDSIFFDDEEHNDDAVFAAAEVTYLRSMRNSLMMQNKQKLSQSQSRLQTYPYDASSELEDDDDEQSLSDADVVFPPDIAKYKIRNGIVSPMAQIEQSSGTGVSMGYGGRKEESLDAKERRYYTREATRGWKGEGWNTLQKEMGVGEVS